MLWFTRAVFVYLSLQLLLTGCTGTVTTDSGSGGGGDSDGKADDGMGESPSDPEVELARFEYQRSDEIFPNPERGFYEDIDLIDDRDYSDVRLNGRTLGFDRVELDDYVHVPLPPQFLDAFAGGLAAARDEGIKVVLRFSYSSSLPGVDASKEMILTHIEQLAPIIEANADVIAVWQAGFIGAWGEWHSSSNDLTNPEDERDILLAMLDALPPSRMLQIRTPMSKVNSIGGPIAEKQAFSEEATARIGHHNDCFLASDSDFGTYSSSDIAQWKSVVAQDGRFAPIGGETCAVNAPRSSCQMAVAEMRQMHWSFLNANYNLDVLDSWIDEGCMDEVERELGYRLSVESAVMPTELAPGGQLDLELRIRNTGFASLYNPRPVYIVLEGGGDRYELPLEGVDARNWEPNKDNKLRAHLRLPADLEEGNYRVAIRLPDEDFDLLGRADYALRLANQDMWDPNTGDNVLTEELWIHPGAPGSVDSSASELVQL